MSLLRSRPVWLVGGLTLVVAVAVAVTVVSAAGHRTGTASGPAAPDSVAPTASTGRSSLPDVACPAATIAVRDTASLTSALAQAKPGDSIRLADGSYPGRFTAGVAGTADRPIFLCGDAGAILDGGGLKSGYAFHLDHADYWRLVGFTAQDAQKGVVADHTSHAVIDGLTVQHIGDEGIHLRSFSSDNLVSANTVRDTGQVKPEFGEGIYVGTAKSNWDQISGGQPDNSDRNLIRDNTISATTAEAVDVKEGTTGGRLIGNTFDGSALSGKNSAESWVNIKGNGWLIQGNSGHDSILDGFKTREVVPGWGRDNTFTANTAVVNGPGYGFDLSPVDGNRVACDNKVTAAALGLANVPCS